MDEPTGTPPRPLATRFGPLVVAAVAVATGLPYLLKGPGFVLDDYYTLFWGWRDGTWHAAGPTQGRARPLGALLYDIVFGVIGPHPLTIAIGQLVLTVGIAVLLLVVLRRFLAEPVAVGAACLWCLLPNHTALDHWASGVIAQVSLLLLVAGAAAQIRSVDRGRFPILATALLCIAPLSYEAVLPACGVVVLAAAPLCRRPFRLPHVAGQLAALAVPALYLVSGSYHLKKDQGWFSFWALIPAHLGWSLTPSRPVGQVLGLFALLGVGACVIRPLSPAVRGLVPPGPARLVLAGVAVIVVGTVAFARYPIEPLGVGDRANTAASIGTALIWTGLLSLAWRHRIAGLAVTTAVCALFAGQVLRRADDWSRSGREATVILDAVVARAKDHPGQLIWVGPRPRYRDGVVGLYGPIDPHATYVGRTGPATGDGFSIRGYVALEPTQLTDVDPALVIDTDQLLGRLPRRR